MLFLVPAVVFVTLRQHKRNMSSFEWGTGGSPSLERHERGGEKKGAAPVPRHHHYVEVAVLEHTLGRLVVFSSI